MIIRTLPLKEIWNLQTEWRSVYAKRYFAATGHWVRAADRHIFDQRYLVQFSAGPKAVLDYETADAVGEFYVVHDDGRFAEVHDAKPALQDYVERLGAIIFPRTLEWTAAVGPDFFDPVYFAMASWVGDEGSDQA